MSDDHKEQKQYQFLLQNLLQKGGADPLGKVCEFLGPGGGRQMALVNTDLANISGKDAVYNSCLAKQEDEKEKKSSELKENKKSQPKDNRIKILGKNSIFQQQKAREIFRDHPEQRLPQYYPRFIADRFADPYPRQFFSQILEKDKTNIAAQSGFAFWSIYKVNPEPLQQKEHIQTILDIVRDNPTHTESLYYLAKLMESGYLHSSRLKIKIPDKDKNLGEIIYEDLGKNIRKDLHQEVYTALSEEFLKQDAEITPQMLYEVILLLDSSHPGASYERGYPYPLKNTEPKIVEERARLLRNVWPVDHRNFGALCQFIEMMYEGLIEPTEEDFVALNQLLARGRTTPTKILDKLQMFVDYANAKARNRVPKLREIHAKLLEDKEAVRRLSLLTHHFGFLKDIEQLPYKQQRLLIEAGKAKRKRDLEPHGLLWIPIVLYSVGITAVSTASFLLAVSDSYELALRVWVSLFLLPCGSLLLMIPGMGIAAISIAIDDVEESSMISGLQATFRTHWTTFFPGMDKKQKQEEKLILDLQLLPEQQRQSIDGVLKNFGNLDPEQKKIILSAAREVETSYASKLCLAKIADSSFPWFVVVAILAPSSYAMYATHQINKSLSIRMEAILAEVVLASLIAYLTYIYFSRHVSKVSTNYVYEQRQNAMVARIAEAAEVKAAPLNTSPAVS